MLKKSFILEPWNYDDPIIPLSHRNKLQPLQELAEKAQSQLMKKPLKLCLPRRDLNNSQFQETSSFLSVRLKRKIFKTEVSSKRLKTESKQKSLFSGNDDRQGGININNRENMKFFKNIVSLVQKQAYKKSKSPRFVLQSERKDILAFPKAKKASQQIITRIKSTQLKIKQHSLDRKDRRKMFKRASPLKDQSNLKSFFFRTIHGKSQSNSSRIRVKQHEIRWKNMLQKSNRRKKEMQQLFKTRMLIGKKEVERRKFNIKIQELFLTSRQNKQDQLQQIESQLFLTHGKDEFSDGAICSSATRKHEQSNSHGD